MAEQTIDIREDNILARSPELLAALLKDHTMSRVKGRDCNIFWATADYANIMQQSNRPLALHVIAEIKTRDLQPPHHVMFNQY